MANYEATRYNFDGGDLTGIQGVNTGLIIPWGDSTVPSGFLNCDGSAVSRTTYAGLFAVIGTNYGSGDGSTTFNIPDLTDRTCVGKSPTKSQFTTGGANTVTTTGNVSGNLGNTTLATPTIATHTHPGSWGDSSGQNQKRPGGGGGACLNTNSRATDATGGGGAHSHPVSLNFTGGTDSVLQPYTTLKYIIKT